jgi:hypothetical protein
MRTASGKAFAHDWVQAWNSVVVHFTAKGRKAAELMEVNSEGLVSRALAHAYAE